MKQEKERTEDNKDAIFRWVNVSRLDDDLTRVGAGVIEIKTPNDEHVRRLVSMLLNLHVILLIAVHDLVVDVVNLNPVVA